MLNLSARIHTSKPTQRAGVSVIDMPTTRTFVVDKVTSRLSPIQGNPRDFSFDEIADVIYMVYVLRVLDRK